MDIYSAAATEVVLPRPLNTYKVDYYEPQYYARESDDDEDNYVLATTTSTKSTTSSALKDSSTYVEESSAYSVYSSEQTAFLADIIHRAIFEATPSQADGPPLPSKVIIGTHIRLIN